MNGSHLNHPSSDPLIRELKASDARPVVGVGIGVSVGVLAPGRHKHGPALGQPV